MGAWLSYGLGTMNEDLPAYVVMTSSDAAKTCGQLFFEHYWSNGFLPGKHQGVRFRGTGDPVPEGDVGEVVVTTFNKAYPLIRFGTGDMSAVLPGASPCGRTNMRIKGWMGRADQRTKVRGMFVDPEQIAEISKKHPGLGRLRLVIDWVNQADVMTLKVEAPSPGAELEKALEGTIRTVCKVGGKVEFVAMKSLPNDGKVIDDVRKYT